MNREALVFWLVFGCALLALCGCASHKNRQFNAFPPRSVAEALAPADDVAGEPIAPPVIESDPSEDFRIVELRREVQTSNNAVQQSLSGLGLQVGKVAEKVEASLVKVESTVNAQTKLESAITTQATAVARVEAKVDASVQGQVGLSNRIDQVNTSVGRDSHTTTQFTDGMERMMTKVIVTMISALVSIVGTTIGALYGMGKLCFGIMKLMEVNRAKDDERDDTNQALFLKGKLK